MNNTVLELLKEMQKMVSELKVDCENLQKNNVKLLHENFELKRKLKLAEFELEELELDEDEDEEEECYHK